MDKSREWGAGKRRRQSGRPGGAALWASSSGHSLFGGWRRAGVRGQAGGACGVKCTGVLRLRCQPAPAFCSGWRCFQSYFKKW